MKAFSSSSLIRCAVLALVMAGCDQRSEEEYGRKAAKDSMNSYPAKAAERIGHESPDEYWQRIEKEKAELEAMRDKLDVIRDELDK